LIKVVFPSDMPLTSDLTSIEGAGMVQGTTTPTIPAGTTNTFTIKGCSTYFPQSGAQLVLSLYNIKNKAFVQTTKSFKIYLYALDQSNKEYPIAKEESGLTFDTTNLSPGPMSSFTVVAAPGGS